MAEKKQLTQKEKRSGCIAMVVLVVIIMVIVFTCGGDKDKTDNKAAPAVSAKITTDSLALLAVLNAPIGSGDHILQVIPAEITEFNTQTCRLRIMLPEDRQGAGAESLGASRCTDAVKWLKENGYDLGLNGIYVSCYVYSKDVGTTGHSDMLTQWGNARYDTNAARVEWQSAK